MPLLRPLDPAFPIERQIAIDATPVVLVNVFTLDKADEQTFLQAWKDAAAKAAILRLHIPIAIGVLALTVLRIAWWWRFDRKPGPVAASPHWQELTAKAVHVLFYLVILGMIASGVGMIALSGATPMIF